ncbi:calcineurin subunit B-like [Glandiceps talaboti]
MSTSGIDDHDIKPVGKDSDHFTGAENHGNIEAPLSDEQIRQLESQTVFKAAEIKKILQRYSSYTVEDDNGSGPNYVTMSSLLQIPEFIGMPLVPRVASMSATQTGALTPESFVQMLSVMSPRTPIDEKRQFLFTMFDMYNEGNIKHDELFRMYKTIFNPALGDDQILLVVSQLLDSTEIPGQISYEEFTQFVPDYEINERLTVELQLS